MVLEHCYWETLTIMRRELERRRTTVDAMAGQLRAAKVRLEKRGRQCHANRPLLDVAYVLAEGAADGAAPPELALKYRTETTLRDQLGRVLNYYNVATDGAFVVASADLLGSTSIDRANEKFPGGFYHRLTNPNARELAIGGICEDAMMAMLSGISAFGGHIGAGSSYGAFSAPSSPQRFWSYCGLIWLYGRRVIYRSLYSSQRPG